MKSKLNILFLTFTMICLLTISLIAQEAITNPVDIIDGIKGATSWSDLVLWEPAIYSFLIVLGGWFSSKIPWLNKVENGTYRVFVWAILVISGGIVVGFGNIWAGAIAYFFSTSLYELVLKWMIPSPKPKTE